VKTGSAIYWQAETGGFNQVGDLEGKGEGGEGLRESGNYSLHPSAENQ